MISQRTIQPTLRWLVAAGCCAAPTAGCYEGSIAADGRGESSGGSTGGAVDTEGGGEDTEDDGIDESLDPGRVTLHRLNATEYENTARDLFFGMDIDPAAEFPPDPHAVGFDNIADVLTMSPVQFELYERSSDALLAAALHDTSHADVRSKLLFCDVDDHDCAVDVVRSFVERAWRRPVDDGALQPLLSEIDAAESAGGTREDGIELAFKHALLSIHFLFRVEVDPDPDSDAPHLLGDFELASRLSYFLWSSMPDDELFAAARDGELQDPDVITEQVLRMLDDPRASALTDNFAGQWLSLRGVRTLTKEPTLFPDFDPELADAMATETEMFFATFLAEDRPFTELLTARETFVNDRLAAHYGIPGPASAAFERVSLQDVPRKGLLTQAGLMAILAHTDVTAPTVRGAWVLGQMLCAPPPAPPANVPDLGGSGSGETVRERLEEHRKNPACAPCHAQMDPIGLSFEHYDATGRYRTLDNGKPIDASGELPDGPSFDDALGLVDVLAADDEAFSSCVAEQLMTYALGRQIEGDDDEGHIARAVADFEAGDHRLPELLVAIARSGAFRSRRAEQ